MSSPAAPATDFLARLAAGAIGAEPTVQPRLPGRFEQTAEVAEEEAPAIAAPMPPVAAPPSPDPPAVVVAPLDARPELTPRPAPPRETRDKSAPQPAPSHAVRSEQHEPAPSEVRHREAPQIGQPALFAPPQQPLLDVPARRTAVQAGPAAPAPPPSQPPIAPAPETVAPPTRNVERVVVQPVVTALPARPEPEKTAPAKVGSPQAVLTPAPARDEVQQLAAPPAPPETVVNIAIGRIEIRSPARPAAPAPLPTKPRPAAQSLDDYLRVRAGKA